MAIEQEIHDLVEAVDNLTTAVGFKKTQLDAARDAASDSATKAADSADEAQEASERAIDAQTDIHSNWQGKLDTAAQQAVIATDKAVEASVSAATANAAKTSAETALAGVEQALNLGAAGIYIDVASGLDGTINTENFWVIPNEGDGIENLTLYNNKDSEAIKLYELYNLESYMIEEGSNWEVSEL